MKTYPFIRVLIKLYWLLLLIVLGLFTVTISTVFFSIESDNSITIEPAKDTNFSAVPPELLMSITKGKKLFKTNCATCHNRNMKSDMTGPALSGVRERWREFPESDLYAWIKNSAKLKESGHPKAVALYAKWKVSMNAFNNMTDAEVSTILDYIDSVK